MTEYEGFRIKGQMRNGKLNLFCEHWGHVFMIDGHIEKVDCQTCSVQEARRRNK